MSVELNIVQDTTWHLEAVMRSHHEGQKRQGIAFQYENINFPRSTLTFRMYGPEGTLHGAFEVKLGMKCHLRSGRSPFQLIQTFSKW